MGERRKALEEAYEDARTVVKRVVDEADPIGLLAMGAPNDEYDDAVERFVSWVLKVEPVTTARLDDWFSSRYGEPPVNGAVLAQKLAEVQTTMRARLEGP